jgi:DNA invertase Pin-like site-specific DNA recombinase
MSSCSRRKELNMPKRNTAASKSRAAAKGKRRQKVTGYNKTSNRPARANSKQATVIAMLSQAEGTTVAAIMEATGWQQKSVRGFFAGIIRKKLGLMLKSEKANGERRYWIVTNKKPNPGVAVADS